MTIAKPGREGRGTDRAHVFAPRGVKVVAHPAMQPKLHPKQTDHFKVSVDPGLGQTGATVADSLLQTCEQTSSPSRVISGV